MNHRKYVYLTIVCTFFVPLEGVGEDGFKNSSVAVVSEPAPENCGKRVHEILDSVEPGKDNSIVYLDLYDVVHNYFITVMDEEEIQSRDDIESTLYNLLLSSNTSQIRRHLETVFESVDDEDILDRIPSSLQQRAERIFFERYPKVNSSEQSEFKRNITGSIDVLCVNRHNVQFVMKANFDSPEGVKYSAKRLAGDGLIEILLWCDTALENNAEEQWEKWKIIRPEERIYIGVACDGVTGRLCMSFYNPSTESEPSYVSS